jgi:exodeoxyribonuclease V alpha subunit
LTIPMTLASRILRLAYAMTVHKFQGLEHEVIVIPVMPSYAAQLQRNLYYTAITRAIEQVIIIGDPDSFARAIANTSGMGRYTRLRNLLEEV